MQCEHRTQEILAACRAAGIQATAHLCDPAQLTADRAAVRARSGCRCGDRGRRRRHGERRRRGVVGTDVALGVIPLGTLNHFAKDLGIDDVDEALAAIARGDVEADRRR